MPYDTPAEWLPPYTDAALRKLLGFPVYVPYKSTFRTAFITDVKVASEKAAEIRCKRRGVDIGWFNIEACKWTFPRNATPKPYKPAVSDKANRLVLGDIGGDGIS